MQLTVGLGATGRAASFPPDFLPYLPARSSRHQHHLHRNAINGWSADVE